jgi:hypothetical protein
MKLNLGREQPVAGYSLPDFVFYTSRSAVTWDRLLHILMVPWPFWLQVGFIPYKTCRIGGGGEWTRLFIMLPFLRLRE